MMGRFGNKVCLVAGAGGGIGGAIAARLAAEGAKLALVDIDEEEVANTKDALVERGGEAIAQRCDITSDTNWRAAIASAKKAYGSLDVVVNAAGVFGLPIADGTKLDFDEWRRVLAINLDGAFLGVRNAVEAMRDTGGAVVTVGSIAGYFGARSGPAYGTSKAGVAALTQQFAFACLRAKINVRVNAVHPGYVLTEPVLKKAIANHGGDEAAARRTLARRNPSNRSISPEDVAGAVAFLASHDARAVNGSNYQVDEGLSSFMPGLAFE
jgi:3(or 17)beta-hydroxysteroid dehydrogenase